jgi:hypothetical protein
LIAFLLEKLIRKQVMEPFDSQYKFVSGSEKVILIEIKSGVIRIPTEKKN